MPEYDTIQKPSPIDSSKIPEKTVNVRIQGKDFKIKEGDSVEYQSIDMMDNTFAIVVFRNGVRMI